MDIDWEPLREIIDAGERFVLTSHVRPDADAIGSEIATALLLERMGKSVRIVNPSDAPSTIAFLDPDGRVGKIGDSVSADEAKQTDVHIVLDTSAWSQLQDVGAVLKETSARKVVIDHHASSDDLGAVEFKDVTAEATGTLVVRMADALGLELPPEAAVPLYCAIATDTGWFRFPSTTSETMRIAGRLIDLGAEPHEIYRRLYEQRSPARVRLMVVALGRIAIECEGRLAWTWVERGDYKQTGATPADTENIVNECLTIEGIDAAFIAVEQLNKSVKVSFRSRTHIDVSAVAEQFGGGGHKQAAGATLKGPVAEAGRSVLDAMKSAVEEAVGENE